MQSSEVTWGVYCDIPDEHSAMTVQVGFSHRDEADETEFCINSWDSQELNELFDDFCRENSFEKC